MRIPHPCKQGRTGTLAAEASNLAPSADISFLVGKQEKTPAPLNGPTRRTHRQDEAPPTLERTGKGAFSVDARHQANSFDSYRRSLRARPRRSQKSPPKELRGRQSRLCKKKKINPADFAKKLLGQIVFLLFSAAKGMAGRAPNGGKVGRAEIHELPPRVDSTSPDKRQNPVLRQNPPAPLSTDALRNWTARTPTIYAPMELQNPVPERWTL